ncbi:MAG TPA: DNA ligase D [Bryobacteraceae bacterium]|nr:DNA ligase D [Bryobacteraceae bacterium]
MDTLKRYTEKRSFDRTPEPAPSSAPRPHDASAPSFCVQRHHASHLHYDLRLEVNGVLKSWAVPKGPTLDPAEKRLAMMVEDHPLEYGGFEGVIPTGNYGAGSVMLWDRGAYELLTPAGAAATAEAQLQRGDFKFRLHGKKLHGEFALVHIKSSRRGSKGNEWLLLKKKDQFAEPGWNTEDHARSVLTGRTQEEIARGLEADPPGAGPAPRDLSKIPGAVRTPMPREVSPMLAALGEGPPPAAPGWLYEVKWDGVRALCTVEDGALKMRSRNGHAIDAQYPELSILPRQLHARSAVIDAEIAALDERGVPSFERLQPRIMVTGESAIATAARRQPAVLFAFDLLYLDGYDLRGAPLIERKRLLKEVLEPNDAIRYSQDFTDGPALYEAARQQGIEGVVGKREQSRYESRRAGDWVKYKVFQSDSFALCGFTEGERDLFGALVLGIYDGGKLKWAGNVGTGFDRKMMEAIHAKLAPLAVKECPLEPDKLLPKAVTWTRPELVCEVKFANWTNDGRLRAPVFMGFRTDLDPSDCIRDRTASDIVPSEVLESRQGGPSGGTNSETTKRTRAAPPVPPLLPADSEEVTLPIDGHRLKFTNLNKVYFPPTQGNDGYRKRDLLNYYNAVAPLILPHLKDRPLSLKRYPNGIEADFFFQKEVAPSFPKWLRTGVADGIRHVIGENRATLLFLVNLGCIDHNPWMSRMGSLEHPDYLLIDLDPQQCGYERIVEAALLVRGKLDLAELASYPKTTGGDGMHLFVPLEPHYSYEQVRGFAELLAAIVAHERPDLFTTPRAVSKREKGKVYFDWAQIAQGKTISAPYVVRAHPGAPVATPLAWNEVSPRLRPEQFHISNALARFDRVGDLFAPVLNRPQRMEDALDRLQARLQARL